MITRAIHYNYGDLLFGYTHSDTYKEHYLSISAPLLSLQFNTVQGWNLNSTISFSKRNKVEGSRLYTSANVGYGITEKKLRVNGRVYYLFNQKTNPFIQLIGGQKLLQFNQKEPISPLINTIASLFFEENYAK